MPKPKRAIKRGTKKRKKLKFTEGMLGEASKALSGRERNIDAALARMEQGQSTDSNQ
jgi:hypothetical protein